MQYIHAGCNQLLWSIYVQYHPSKYYFVPKFVNEGRLWREHILKRSKSDVRHWQSHSHIWKIANFIEKVQGGKWYHKILLKWSCRWFKGRACASQNLLCVVLYSALKSQSWVKKKSWKNVIWGNCSITGARKFDSFLLSLVSLMKKIENQLSAVQKFESRKSIFPLLPNTT